jgi:hypothetical protein
MDGKLVSLVIDPFTGPEEDLEEANGGLVSLVLDPPASPAEDLHEADEKGAGEQEDDQQHSHHIQQHVLFNKQDNVD